MSPLLFLLIFLCVCVLVYYIVWWMKLPTPADRIVKVILGILAIYVLLNHFGLLSGLK